MPNWFHRRLKGRLPVSVLLPSTTVSGNRLCCSLMEMNLKALSLLLVILFCSTSLYAENVSVLTELELIQEKLWYLQRDMGTQKASLEEQQKQLRLLTSGADKERLELNEDFAALTKANADQKEGLRQIENDLETLGESLIALTTEVRQLNSVLLDQAGKIGILEGSLNALQDELVAQQNDTGQALAELGAQFAETRAQMVETRSQIDTLGQDVGGRVEQIGYLGAGAALVLIIVLITGFLVRKNRENSPRIG